jgi:abortive infection bacteriophage resistance protein
MGGASFYKGVGMKPGLSLDRQVALMKERGLIINDESACFQFLGANSYYRFSGYARYFQEAPHLGDDRFRPGITFDQIREIYDADEYIKHEIMYSLAKVELMLRTRVIQVVVDKYSPYKKYLERGFYVDSNIGIPTAESCIQDIERSRDRHILHYRQPDNTCYHQYQELPIWSAVEAWSFGTLSKVIERGAQGSLTESVALSTGVAKAGFASRIRALVYLRNRCAHHSRLWNHSVIDAGSTPNNVRVKAKKLAGQFEPRSVIDIIASLDDISLRSKATDLLLPRLVEEYSHNSEFWSGLSRPQNPRDHVG